MFLIYCTALCTSSVIDTSVFPSPVNLRNDTLKLLEKNKNNRQTVFCTLSACFIMEALIIFHHHQNRQADHI